MRPALGYLSFTGKSGCYAALPLSLLPNATTFTIEVKFATASTKNTTNNYTWGTIAGREIGGYWQDDFGLCVNNGKLRFWAQPKAKNSLNQNTGGVFSNTVVNDGEVHKVAVVSSNGAIDLYCDGVNVAHTDNVNAKITSSYAISLAYNGADSSSYLQMDLYEARFWNTARAAEDIWADIDGTETGLQGWYLPSDEGLKDYSGNNRHATLYGNPAYTEIGYNVSFDLDVVRHIVKTVSFDLDVARYVFKPGQTPVEFSLDVARKIVKTVTIDLDVARIVTKTWRYTNPGTADGLTTSGTTLTNLPATKSKTGTAFYQTTRAKCFDLPATQEIWLKFDVYFDGTNRWRAYNGGNNGTTGITAQTSSDLSFFSNANNVQQPTGVCKTNTLQTVLLHMQAGTTDGIIEAWVDGDFIYRYTGNVNNGEDFADIYLQSDGAGTVFSNVIISNGKVGLNDGFQIFSVDVARRVTNVITLNLDVARYVLKPVTVPLIGEHFNHYIRSIIVSNSPTTFKLPKKSKVYIHATSPVDTSPRVQWRAVRIFTDTDAAGTVTGDVYATFDECERVSIQSTVSPQSILSDFTWKLRDLGGDKLDAAIEYCTGGLFTTKDELADSFLTDLDNSESNLDFLLRCCGVDLSNDDTGAVVGSDAGGGHPKTTKLIVPEPVPVEEWVVPGSGSSKYIYGLTVYFPTTGANGALTDAEKHILAGLNSVWIYQALWLIDKSCKMEFANLPTQRTRSISVKFVNETNNTLAYVAATYSGNWAIKLELCINMRVYSAIDITSEDGATSNQNDTYLDRTLAHEFTHAVMAAGIGRYSDLPLFIKEGIAEFIHGIDDERRSSIRHITQPAQRGTLQTIFSTGGTAGDEDVYSAGYLFFRYMVRQTLERGNLPLPPSDTMYNLVISDGAIDYFGRALTDNTRQLFGVDVARTLVRSCELILDVVIRDMIRVEFNLDVARALSAELILFPIDDPPPVVNRLMAKAPLLKADAPTKKNTQGIQSFEVSIAEQQVTEQVNFIGVIPFDIMQKVKGQYLDYHYDMRVERVQQEGMIYRCECCSDLDQLLYTQLAYKIPPSTWRIVGEDDKTVEVQTHYPPAGAHIQKIAAALGLSVVTRFDNFLSTVLMDDLGGLTYSDLIRDVFGWSSRIPHQLINVYIRNGVLYVIQRGHESRTIDITNEKCTRPVITKELVRTTWGSTPWSKTQTFETTQNFWQASIPDDVTISGGDATTPSTPSTPDLPDLPDVTIPGGDTQDDKVREVSTRFEGQGYRGHTTYTYDKSGLLIQTYTYTEKDVEGSFDSQETHTYVYHEYDDDGTMIGTVTKVQSFGGEGDSASKSVEEKFYVTLPNGEKFLASEYSASYQNDGSVSLSDADLVDSKVTVHSPSRVGQTHTITINSDGEIVGAAAGQDTGDNRVTPYSQHKTALLGKQLFARTSNGSSGGSSGGTSSIPSGDDSSGSGSSGEWVKETKTKELTTHGVALYDSSFPIHDEAKLIQVTNALKWLNRKTRETLNISVYEFPHLIDFDDRVIFDGKEYFLVSNTATTTARVFNEQNLTLARWY